MRYHALACDFDGTLANNGHVDGPTLAALEKLLASGRRLIMVTGRELGPLQESFAHLELFEWIVAENGGLLYRPTTKEEIVLSEAPIPDFVERLKGRGVTNLSVGRSIVAGWTPHETTILETIRDMGLELHVIFNKGAVMVLPSGVNKASGLKAALKHMKLSVHEVVGVGDAENDHAFMSLCECSAAVSNALPAVKERADIALQHDHGAGVVELIEQIVQDDLASLTGRIPRHQLLFGTQADGVELRLPPYGASVLIAGPSGSGKSTSATSLLERFLEHRYQFCIIDPEGDYEGVEGSITLGTADRGPTVEEVLEAMVNPAQNAVVNLIGMPVTDRPPFFLGLLPRLQEMRARTGRPHWLIIDEAHHLLPVSWQPGAASFPTELQRAILITVHPDQIAPAAAASAGTMIAVGAKSEETIGLFCKAIGKAPPAMEPTTLEAGEVLLWRRNDGKPPVKVKVAPSRIERRRHTRKYAEGELPADRSFYFRGAKGKLNLRAQNLLVFVQMADGVDDGTWNYHLKQHDYSKWFRACIKDEDLAAEAENVEGMGKLQAAESRRLIRAAVESRYTLPAASPLPMPGTDAAAVHQPHSEHKADAKSGSKPATKADLKSDSKAASKPDPKAETKPDPKADSKPAAAASTKAVPPAPAKPAPPVGKGVAKS